MAIEFKWAALSLICTQVAASHAVTPYSLLGSAIFSVKMASWTTSQDLRSVRVAAAAP
jgi:hypothetical protein